MMLWCEWWRWCAPLKAACGRQRTFMWMCVVLAGFCVREDLWGVTSFVRALGLQGPYYDRLLDFLHSPSLCVDKLARLWTALVVANHTRLMFVNGRIVVLGDGIKVPKAGRKMPGVKHLYQGGESNTKPEYILGHSCQAIAVLAGGLASFTAIPLAARIHEGLVFSNRDQRTLLDKMVLLLKRLAIDRPYYFVADAYYASRKIALPLLNMGQHLVTRARKRPGAGGPSSTASACPSRASSGNPNWPRRWRAPSTASPASSSASGPKTCCGGPWHPGPLCRRHPPHARKAHTHDHRPHAPTPGRYPTLRLPLQN